MNEFSIEIAGGRKLQSDKGDDELLIRSQGDAHLLAVVDGLSMAEGRVAAAAVIRVLSSVEQITDARRVYQEFVTRLPCGVESPDSATTLTCGILRAMQDERSSWLHFDFFAIGDSPVWRVVKLAGDGPYSFQRYIIHGAPYPGEPAKVYSTVRPHNPVPVRGSVAFGSVDIPFDETLIICTDGVPERRIFSREAQRIDGNAGEGRYNFCHWMFGAEQLADVDVVQYLDAYNSQGVLYDDATLIVARLRAPAPSGVAAEPALSVSEAGEYQPESALSLSEADASAVSSVAAAEILAENSELIAKDASGSNPSGDPAEEVATDDLKTSAKTRRTKRRASTAPTQSQPRAPRKRK